MLYQHVLLLPIRISKYFTNMQTLWITNSGMEFTQQKSIKDLKQIKQYPLTRTQTEHVRNQFVVGSESTRIVIIKP